MSKILRPAVQSVAATAPTPPAEDPAAIQRKADAERAALAEAQSRGRRSTIVAGMALAADEQQKRGLGAAARRNAARTLGD